MMRDTHTFLKVSNSACAQTDVSGLAFLQSVEMGKLRHTKNCMNKGELRHVKTISYFKRVHVLLSNTREKRSPRKLKFM